MKHELAKTKNVTRFLGAVGDLKSRPMGVEGMGLLYGRPGEGKSTVVAYATNTMGGVFLRANACWTVTSLLGSMMRELGYAPLQRRSAMIDVIVQRLIEEPRPMFIDEADYLLRQAEMLDTVRDIYDLTGAPVVLIGMDAIARKIALNGRFARRITQWLEFAGVDLADARVVADTVCEVGLSDDLLEHVYRESQGNIGRIVTALSKIEPFGRANRLSVVDLSDWGDRPLYYGQPQFSRQAQ